jgi:hypothetical protein
MSAACVGSAWANMADDAARLRQKSPMAEKSTHPLDFHDHDGDGFDRAVGVVKSAEVASMEVVVCIVVCMELSEVKPGVLRLGPS